MSRAGWGCLLFLACSSREAPGFDGGLLPIDAGVTADAGAADAGPGVCQFCLSSGPCDEGLCAARVTLAAGVPLSNQVSDAGGFGDCATSASGKGGPSLYYSVTVPAMRAVQVTMRQTQDAGYDAMLRWFPDCGSTATTLVKRGGLTTGGGVSMCVHNPGAAEQRWVVAASRYSGESAQEPFVFDLSLELLTTVPQSCD